ncbi:MAG: hypothetical protein RI897_3631 [Verrucomicrobiota bacterium]|jgi:hypothetical protein
MEHLEQPGLALWMGGSEFSEQICGPGTKRAIFIARGLEQIWEYFRAEVMQDSVCRYLSFRCLG